MRNKCWFHQPPSGDGSPTIPSIRLRRFDATKSPPARCSSSSSGLKMLTALALYLLLLPSTSHARSLPFNASILPLSAPSYPSFLKEVVEAIAAKERWDPRAEVRVSEFDARSALVGYAQRYEFHIQTGGTVLIVRFSEVDAWRRPGRGEGLGPDLAATGRRPVIGALELDGPLDLLVGDGDGDGDGDELSLLLPAMNITYKGLRRVLVGDGIGIKVVGAQEVSLVHPYGIGVASDGNSVTLNDDGNQFWMLGRSSCSPLLSLHVLGSVSLVAYKTQNSEAYIETAFLSHDTIELLQEKCYNNGQYKQSLSYSFGSLRSRLAVVEEDLESFLGYRLFQNRSTRFLKAKITSPTLVKFRIELEREITEGDRIWKKAAEWRTRPAVERHLFEIVARVGGGRVLKPLIVKKVMRPFMVVDSTTWSNLMSNISFTQFPSIVVPPEALTLDMKW